MPLLTVLDLNALSHALSYLTEYDLVNFEDAYPFNGRIRDASRSQWHHLSKLEKTLGKRRWRRGIAISPSGKKKEKLRAKKATDIDALVGDKPSKTRANGREFVRLSKLAGEVADEALSIYGYTWSPSVVTEYETLPDNRKVVKGKCLRVPIKQQFLDKRRWNNHTTKHFESWTGMEKLIKNFKDEISKESSSSLLTTEGKEAVGCSETPRSQLSPPATVFIHIRLLTNNVLNAREGGSIWCGACQMKAKFRTENDRELFQGAVKLDWENLIEALDWEEGRKLIERLKKEMEQNHRLSRQRPACGRLMRNMQVSIFYNESVVISTGGMYRTESSHRGYATGEFHPRLAQSPLQNEGPQNDRYEIRLRLDPRKKEMLLLLEKKSDA